MSRLSLALAAQLRRRVDAVDEHTIYGVSWDKGTSPILTRTDAAVGMIAAAGVGATIPRNDFDRASIYRDITEVVDALGNVFVRIPKFYIRKTDTANLKTWQISRHQHNGFYLPWCFWDFANHRELPFVDVGKYKGTLETGNRLGSRPNVYQVVS